MESKVKHVKIKDGGNVKEFTIRLFGVLEGLEFIDKFVADIAQFIKGGASAQSISIRKMMRDLLPLATYIGGDGKPVDTMSYDKLDTYFENPLSAIELAMDILEHQMVFMNESEQFQQYLKPVLSLFHTPSSDSATQSETSSTQK